MPTQEEKLAFLRKFVKDCPDIYHIPGFKPNGCGPEEWKIDVVPDQFPGLPSVEAAGDYHDYLYFVGGNKEDKKKADLELKRLMRATCPFGWHPLKMINWFRMRRLSWLYWTFVDLFGHSFFNFKSN